MSAARKIHTLTFHLIGLAGEDEADEILDDIEEFADDLKWPLEQPDAYKYKQSETDRDVRCAVELAVRASLSSGTIEGDKGDFAGAMALVEHLRQLSARHGLDVEVDFDEETIGTIEKGVFSEPLREGLIEPWQAG
jgi:hypothetical protein